MKDIVQALNLSTKYTDIQETIRSLCTDHPEKVVFSSSFSIEDQVITHFIFSNNIPVNVFTIDTGRMFAETYAVFGKTLEKYNKTIKVYFPENNDIEKLMSEKGPFSFYDSVENRKECCYLRKIKPLKRALTGNDIWITGLRGEQSESRKKINIFEWDENNKIIKYNPLLHWSTEQIREYIKTNQIPYNILHDQSFPSIGCQPCTRKINEGEDFRAGRWWWENNSKKECGLHS